MIKHLKPRSEEEVATIIKSEAILIARKNLEGKYIRENKCVVIVNDYETKSFWHIKNPILKYFKIEFSRNNSKCKWKIEDFKIINTWQRDCVCEWNINRSMP